MKPDDFDALVLPGGVSPDKLRANKVVTDWIRAIYDAGKPTAAICHGPSLLISAGNILRGKNATSWYSIRDDLRNAGANVLEAAPVIDGNLITARMPPDLLVFVRAVQKLSLIHI